MVLDIKKDFEYSSLLTRLSRASFFKLVHAVAACSKREENSRTRRGDCMVVRCAAWRIAPLVAQVFESIGDRILGKVASQRSVLPREALDPVIDLRTGDSFALLYLRFRARK